MSKREELFKILDINSAYASSVLAQHLGITPRRVKQLRCEWKTLRGVQHSIEVDKALTLDSLTHTSPAPQQTGVLKETESHIHTHNGWEILLKPQARIKSLEQLIEAFNIDTSVWDVEKFVANKWDGITKTSIEELYQIKAFLKKKPLPEQAIPKAIGEILEELKQARPAQKLTYDKKSNTCLLELAIFDAHFGKLAWEAETGTNYDIKEAVETYKNVAKTLVARASAYNIDRILLVIGNDMLNIDSNSNMTTAGTPQDSDSRYFKVVQEVIKTITDVVDTMLLPVAPVDVIAVQGNHDYHSTVYLGMVLDAIYKSNENVNVIWSPQPYHYYTYGTNLIMFNHGDTIKEADLPIIMATDKPKEWAIARTLGGATEVHLGHTHKQTVLETKGVISRHIRAMCPTDKWCKKNGYVNNVRGGEAFIFEKAGGLIGTAYVNL